MKKAYFIISLLFFCLSAINAQETEDKLPDPKPIAFVVESNQLTTDSISISSERSLEAPVNIQFYANAPEVDGYILTCIWEFFKDGELYDSYIETDVLVELTESGVITVKPTISYTSLEDDEEHYVWDENSPFFSIIIAESGLEAPNAFSPNGDGNHDYYNVYDVESIVEFHGAIYNRWGQELFRWGIDEIGNPECGWDGTYNGRQVSDGVYYVVINAKGADGVIYEIRRDVNLLRGYTEVGK